MKAELYWIPEAQGGRLAVMPRPRGGEWLEDEVRAWGLAGVDRVVSLLTQAEMVELDLKKEPGLCQAYQVGYLSHPIPDRRIPASTIAAVALLKNINQWLQQGENVAIHCRMGIGRAALIAAGVLIVQGLEAPGALAAVGKARGVEVPDTEEQKQWVMNLVKVLVNP